MLRYKRCFANAQHDGIVKVQLRQSAHCIDGPNQQPTTANLQLLPITHRLTIKYKKQRHYLGFLAHGDAEVAGYLSESDGAEDEYEKADPKPAIPMLPVGEAVANNANGEEDID